MSKPQKRPGTYDRSLRLSKRAGTHNTIPSRASGNVRLPASTPVVRNVGFRARTRHELTIPMLVVAAIATVLSTLGALEVVRDPYSDNPIAGFGIAAPAITAAWMTIELCWTRKGEPFMPRFGFRLFALGGIFVLIGAAVHAVVLWQPAWAAAENFPEDYASHSAAWLTFVAFALIGFAANLGGGVAGLLLVVLPFFLIFRPQAYAEANMLEGGAENLRSARLSGFALVLLLNLTFAVPSLIVFGNQYNHEPMVIIGWALIPLGVVALVAAAVLQRPDRARRKAAGLRR